MGQHLDKAVERSAGAAWFVLWLNLAVTSVCLLYYAAMGSADPLIVLALYALLFNGGALAIGHFELKQARQLDAEEAIEAARAEAARERRWAVRDSARPPLPGR